jgi:hypothetical protein
MTPELRLRIAAIGLGAAIWAIGARVDNATLRWSGIAVLAVVFISRFFREKGSSRREDAQ